MKPANIAFVFTLVVAAVLLAIALSGCVALERPDEEIWQALHAVDVGEAFKLHDEPCQPSRPWMPGTHDSNGAVIAIGAGEAGIHALVTGWLANNDHPTLLAAWQMLTIGEAVGSSVHSMSIGFQSGIAQSMGCTAGAPPTDTLERTHP